MEMPEDKKIYAVAQNIPSNGIEHILNNYYAKGFHLKEIVRSRSKTETHSNGSSTDYFFTLIFVFGGT